MVFIVAKMSAAVFIGSVGAVGAQAGVFCAGVDKRFATVYTVHIQWMVIFMKILINYKTKVE